MILIVRFLAFLALLGAFLLLGLSDHWYLAHLPVALLGMVCWKGLQ